MKLSEDWLTGKWCAADNLDDGAQEWHRENE
jgi:hypothetical protein